jgi:hypothetical protein
MWVCETSENRQLPNPRRYVCPKVSAEGSAGGGHTSWRELDDHLAGRTGGGAEIVVVRGPDVAIRIENHVGGAIKAGTCELEAEGPCIRALMR